MRIAFVAACWGDPWSEEQIFARRVAGALGSRSEVELLLAGHDSWPDPADGAFTVRKFAAEAENPHRFRRLSRFTVDSAGAHEALSCSCAHDLLERVARSVPQSLQFELARARGGHSPELYAYLRDNPYDLVVLVGLSPVLVFGLKSLPDDRRIALIPGRAGDRSSWLPVYDEAFRRADAILVPTARERKLVARRAGMDDGRAVNVGFALRVSSLSAETEPVLGVDAPYLLVVGDWASSRGLNGFLRQAGLLGHERPEIGLVFAGRRHDLLRRAGRVTAYGTELRADLWRWMSRALAVVDLEPERSLGRDVLEAFLYGVPVLVRADGGAAREHAEDGNGGLWYRNYDEFELAISQLASDEIGPTLGSQGREYALREYGDPESFRRRVVEACLG